MDKNVITTQLYLGAFKNSGVKIQGGTIHQFLKNSRVKYSGGKCPIYQIEYFHDERRVVIGGNYATNGKPVLRAFEPLDFT